jgi:hypothetical protein
MRAVVHRILRGRIGSVRHPIAVGVTPKRQAVQPVVGIGVEKVRDVVVVGIAKRFRVPAGDIDLAVVREIQRRRVDII